jgi:hypothetical protein
MVTALIQYFLSTRSAAKRRTHDERKEAYIGLAEAWVRQEQDGVSDKNMLDVGHWLLRCQFVAPPEMLPLLANWAASQPDSTSRAAATDHLKTAMRNDLSDFQ